LLALRARAAASGLDAEGKSNVLFQLDTKVSQFQDAFRNLLGLGLTVVRTGRIAGERRPSPGQSAEETSDSVTPGETFYVRMHTFHAAPGVQLAKAWFVSETGSQWQNGQAMSTEHTATTEDAVFKVQVPDNAETTKPYFTRPDLEQAHYDVLNPKWRGDSFAPWPLAGWAEFSFDGVPIRLGRVVQTLQRVTGPGGFYEPLVVTPAIDVRVQPQARILPLNGGPLPVRVNVNGQAAADGTVELKLPAGWRADPPRAQFHIAAGGSQALD